MTPSGFFTIEDLTHVHIKQFPSGVLQPYVEEAESQYLDISMQLGVDPEDIVTPLPILSTRYCNAYVNYRFAEDSIGSNNVEVTENDMYVRMNNEFEATASNLLKQLTPEFIQGISENSRQARSISTGKLYRDE